jgi:hypothetical protein
MINFKEKYIKGECSYEEIDDWIDEWHTSNVPGSLQDFLGFDEDDMQLFGQGDTIFKEKLDRLKCSALRKQKILAKALERLVHPGRQAKGK